MSAPHEPDGHLWDGSGPEDPLVAALERQLAGFRHPGTPLRWSPTGSGTEVSVLSRASRRRPRHVARWLLLAAGLLLALGLGWHFALRPAGDPAGAERVVLREGVTDRTIAATKSPREVHLPGVGDITVHPGSTLRIDRWSDQGARLDLRQGGIEAFVYPSVAPRFFQVATPAAQCVDLGCRYTLTVDEQGVSHVNVTLGYVAFAIADLEVFVPRGAECRAHPDLGPGTPRFRDCPPELRRALDALDARPRADAAGRREPARAVAAAAGAPRDTLPLYHLLLERDPGIRDVAERRLVELVDWPDSARDLKAPSCDSGEWLGYLRTMWW